MKPKPTLLRLAEVKALHRFLGTKKPEDPEKTKSP